VTHSLSHTQSLSVLSVAHSLSHAESHRVLYVTVCDTECDMCVYESLVCTRHIPQRERKKERKKESPICHTHSIICDSVSSVPRYQ